MQPSRSSNQFPTTQDRHGDSNNQQRQSQTPRPRAEGAIARTVSEGSTTGKRKADEVDSGTPPDKKEHKTTFAADNRPHRQSGTSASASTAPSSYTRKRARLSNASSPDARLRPRAERSPGHRQHQHQSSPSPSPRAHVHRQHSSHGRHDSTASRTSRRSTGPGGTMPFAAIFEPPPEAGLRPPSRATRPPSRAASSIRRHVPSVHRAPSRISRSSMISGSSIPISALVAPRAPSVSIASQSRHFHMRDPHRPPRVHSTPWSLSLPSPGDDEYPRWQPWKGEGASPIQAWIFFVSFVLFPLWWVGGFMLKVPKTRRIGDTADLEKGKMPEAGTHSRDDSVVLDDPQVEHDARTWRTRCRIMAVVSLFTYVPFIVCIAVFAPH
ncbi:hypothetical protein EV122DRAFT_217092 [Schizophyllum commune]